MTQFCLIYINLTSTPILIDPVVQWFRTMCELSWRILMAEYSLVAGLISVRFRAPAYFFFGIFSLVVFSTNDKYIQLIIIPHSMTLLYALLFVYQPLPGM